MVKTGDPWVILQIIYTWKATIEPKGDHRLSIIAKAL